MNTHSDPDFGEIPAHIADRLRGADARFREWQGEFNPFRERTALAEVTSFGTRFSVYDARGQELTTPGVVGAEPVPLLVIYAAQSRLAGLCDLAATRWVPELPVLVEALADSERLRRPAIAGQRESGPPPDPDAEVVLETFGLQVAADSYILGYRDARSPLVVRKELILDLLELLAAGLIAIGDSGGNESERALSGEIFGRVRASGKID